MAKRTLRTTNVRRSLRPRGRSVSGYPSPTAPGDRPSRSAPASESPPVSQPIAAARPRSAAERAPESKDWDNETRDANPSQTEAQANAFDEAAYAAARDAERDSGPDLDDLTVRDEAFAADQPSDDAAPRDDLADSMAGEEVTVRHDFVPRPGEADDDVPDRRHQRRPSSVESDDSSDGRYLRRQGWRDEAQPDEDHELAARGAEAGCGAIDDAANFEELASTPGPGDENAAAVALSGGAPTGRRESRVDEPTDQLLMANFFSEPPPPPADTDDVDCYHPPLTVGSRRAMWASAAIFAASVICIGSYTAYHSLVMPVPVELGTAGPAELVMPTPLPAPAFADRADARGSTLLGGEPTSGAAPAAGWAAAPASALPRVADSANAALGAQTPGSTGAAQPANALAGQPLGQAPSGLGTQFPNALVDPVAAAAPGQARPGARAQASGTAQLSAASAQMPPVESGQAPNAAQLRAGQSSAASAQATAFANGQPATAAQPSAAAALAAHIGTLPPVPPRATNSSRSPGAASGAAQSGVSPRTAPNTELSNLDGRGAAARPSFGELSSASAALDPGEVSRPAVEPSGAPGVTETSLSAASDANRKAGAQRSAAAPAAQSASEGAAERRSATEISGATSAATSAASAAQSGASTSSAQLLAASGNAQPNSSAATGVAAANAPEPTATGQARTALVADSMTGQAARSSTFGLGPEGRARSADAAASNAPAHPETRASGTTAKQGASSAPERARASLTPTIEPEAANALQVEYADLIEVGHEFARKNRTNEALEAFRRALDLEPNGVAALGGIAYVYLNLNDAATAKLYATRTLQSDPTDSQGWIVLGAALEQLGDRLAAREAYRRCATEGTGSYVAECRALAPR